MIGEEKERTRLLSPQCHILNRADTEQMCWPVCMKPKVPTMQHAVQNRKASYLFSWGSVTMRCKVAVESRWPNGETGRPEKTIRE